MLLNIVSTLTTQTQIIFGILLLILLSQTLIRLALQKIFGAQFTSNEYFSLSLAGWLLPASLLSLLTFPFWGSKPFSPFNLFLLISLFSIPILFRSRFKPYPEPASRPTTLFLLLFFSATLLLRLAFVSKTSLPSYFDSAVHYLLIKNITTNLLALTTSYYHLGFHFLIAFITSTFQAEITKTMLILGQIILTVLPLSTFFFINDATKSNLAGIFTVSLAAFGWYMPAHAVDWGKYPALMSLGLLPFVLSLMYLAAQNKNILIVQKQRALYVLTALGILISAFMHSRSLIIIGIVSVSWLVGTWRQKLPQRQQAFLLFVVLIAIITEIIYIQGQPVLNLLFDPYLHQGLWVTALVLILSIFAQRAYPQLTFTNLLTVFFLLGSLFIPLPDLVPGHAKLTLLDRPYIEMLLFLPLTLLGGLGLAGLEKSIKLKPIGLIVIALVLVNAFFTYNLYPSDCCVIAGYDDITAIDWLDNQLPPDARIGISATTLNVLADETFEGYVGGDAGVWITPLTNRVTLPIRYDSNFGDQNILNSLCQLKINYLYIGELGQTFNAAQINARPAWYKVMLSMPKVKIYQVIGCG